jgi:hypothetical protein
MTEQTEDKDKTDKNIIFEMIQNFLKAPPVIIWGSGATIPLGMPSMDELNTIIKNRIPDFDKKNKNLEKELGNEKYKKHLPEIRNLIHNTIKEKDNKILQQIMNNDFHHDEIVEMIKKFCKPCPKILNLISTNYDKTLEYVMAYNEIPFTDGFSGRTLSIYEEDAFKDKNFVNLIKVHGSIDWYDVNGEVRSIDCDCQYQPEMIIPGKNKYEESSKLPYRDLIQKSDQRIEEAKSFLVIGFGFNDEHLTPRIKSQTKKGVPIVVVTKKITSTTKEELKDASRYIFVEQMNGKKTKITYKNGSHKEEAKILDGQYWQLANFLEVV